MKKKLETGRSKVQTHALTFTKAWNWFIVSPISALIVSFIIGGIVITQFDRRKTLNKSVAELVKDAFCDKVFRTVIRDNVSLAEAPIKGKNIFEYNRNSNGAKDYMALAQEVLKLK